MYQPLTQETPNSSALKDIGIPNNNATTNIGISNNNATTNTYELWNNSSPMRFGCVEAPNTFAGTSGLMNFAVQTDYISPSTGTSSSGRGEATYNTYAPINIGNNNNNSNTVDTNVFLQQPDEVGDLNSIFLNQVNNESRNQQIGEEVLNFGSLMSAYNLEENPITMNKQSSQQSSVQQLGGETMMGSNFSTLGSQSGDYFPSFCPNPSQIEVYIAGGRMFDGNIVGYDVHYNLAIINILSDVPLPVAKLRLLDDSVSIDPALVHSSQEARDNVQLRPHSRAFKICAEEVVVALGRNCENFDIMVAPGKFSLDDCKYDCMELMMATCRITKPGVGGPLVNCYGEVIGVNFMNEQFTPFLAVNIVDKWLNHFKRYGKFCRPWIGVEAATNLYAAEVEELEHIVLNNPNVSRGVFVEAVVIGSPADRAGIQCNDVIIQCNGKSVEGFLKFCRKMLVKAGKSVEVGVIRRGYDGILKLNIAVEEFTPDRFNSWPLPKEYTLKIQRYREC